jgi:hypothetical protein
VVLYHALRDRADVAQAPASLAVSTAALDGEHSLSRNAHKNAFELFHFTDSFRAVTAPDAVFGGLERILTLNFALAQVIHIARAFGHNVSISVIHSVLSFPFCRIHFQGSLSSGFPS